MPRILSAIACNLDTNILAATLPLLERAQVEAIEWSFDTLESLQKTPPFFIDLLHAFSKENRLIGHGVFFSIFSGKLSKAQKLWLQQLKQMCSVFSFDHITEHFGFVTGRNFHHGAPLSVPYSPTTLRIGVDRLKRIYDACQCPVGLENLAFAYTLDEVKRHGEFLAELLEPINGFVILDLHNLYCQIENFSISFEEIIKYYRLDLIREIHISGGSWIDSVSHPKSRVRRDTHNEAVPPEVFELLKQVIDLCPELKYVVLEQLGSGLQTTESKFHFQNDFLKMKAIVEESNRLHISAPNNAFLPDKLYLSEVIAEDALLYQQQMELSDILETVPSFETALHRLTSSTLANSDWQIESWDHRMLETALDIANKWKRE